MSIDSRSSVSIDKPQNGWHEKAEVLASPLHVAESLSILIEAVAQLNSKLDQVNERLSMIEQQVCDLAQQRAVKDYYTTDEIGKLLGRSGYTVREYCRNGRINGQKKGSGRGRYRSWVVSHDELLRIQRHGLLPPASNRRAK